jgi:hypothetical protein
MDDEIDTASNLAAKVYPKVFRTDFSQPGFALINFGPTFGSHVVRRAAYRWTQPTLSHSL